MKTSRIIAMAALVTMLILVMGLSTACGPTPTPTTAPTAAPKPVEPTKAPVVEPTKAPVVEPTKAPVAGLNVPAPATSPTVTATAKVINAAVSIVSVAANPAKDPNVLTATVKLMTDTVVGAYNAVIAMGATGLNNVPVNVPVHLACASDDPKNLGKPAWTLNKPADSKAAIKDAAAAKTEFTPDVPGWYQPICNLGGGGQVGAVQLRAGAYIGMTEGKCVTCHPTKVAEWTKTGHAKIFTEEIDLKPTHYTESCASCHTTGYYADPYGKGANGFKDVTTKANWAFPTYKQIETGGNWAAAPAAVKNMANIQCEQCHGPAADHVKNGAPMASSIDEGVCNVCHNGSSRHDKGEQLKSAGHSNAAAPAFNTPVGPARQACVRCHSGKGYVSFLKDPTNPAAWDNSKQTIVCSTCHDAHSEENAWQLRVIGKPVGLPFEVKKDLGLSATCFECHNSRVSSDDFAAGKSTSTPHYSSVAELVSDTGGVTYGQTVPNSPHGAMVGTAPIANPAFAKDNTLAPFLFSAAASKTGNVPGPCVVCHMWPIISDTKDPNFEKVGGHSFNTVSPDGKFEYGAACKSCHGDVTDFNLKAKADYDGNGKVEGVQDEVKGLLNTLWKAMEAKGVTKVTTGNPYANLPKDAAGKVDPKLNNAWFNFRMVYGVMWGTETGNGNEGKAQAIHNFKRSVALLQLSYKDLTGADIAGATLMK
jgi:hypothetical protein